MCCVISGEIPNQGIIDAISSLGSLVYVYLVECKRFSFLPLGGAYHERAEHSFCLFSQKDRCVIDIVYMLRKFQVIWMILNVCYRIKGGGAGLHVQSVSMLVCYVHWFVGGFGKSYMFACSRLDMFETKNGQEGTE